MNGEPLRKLSPKQLTPFVLGTRKPERMRHDRYEDLHTVVRTKSGDNAQHEVDREELLLRKTELGGDLTEYPSDQNQPENRENDMRERMNKRWEGMPHHFKLNDPSNSDRNQQESDNK